MGATSPLSAWVKMSRGFSSLLPWAALNARFTRQLQERLTSYAASPGLQTGSYWPFQKEAPRKSPIASSFSRLRAWERLNLRPRLREALVIFPLPSPLMGRLWRSDVGVTSSLQTKAISSQSLAAPLSSSPTCLLVILLVLLVLPGLRMDARLCLQCVAATAATASGGLPSLAR